MPGGRGASESESEPDESADEEEEEGEPVVEEVEEPLLEESNVCCVEVGGLLKREEDWERDIFVDASFDFWRKNT